MIVITGPGRSGTSFLARIYQELGFDPVLGGGGWDLQIRGGLEDVEVGKLNGRLVTELGMRSSMWWLADAARRLRVAGDGQIADTGAVAIERTASRTSQSRLGSLVNRAAASTTGRRVRMMRWERVPAIVVRHRAEMRRIARSRQVVKDPAFCQTLALWAAADAEIDHVVISLRSVHATAAGLLRTGHLPAWARGVAENEIAYRLGLLLAAVTDHRLSYSIVRFPDFLDDGDALYDALRFPEPVSREQLLEVFNSVRSPELVGTWK